MELGRLAEAVRGRPVAGMVLTLAHVFALGSVVSFRVRIGGAPLGDWGLAVYAAAVLAAGLACAFVWRGRGSVSAAVLVAASAPAIASLLFWLGLTGEYAPWDPFDSDVFGVLFPVYGAAAAAVAVLYGSYRYLVGSVVALVALCVLGGPGAWLDYGLNSVLGRRADALTYLLVAMLIGAGLIWYRLRLRWEAPRSIWPADVILGVTGAWLLYYLLSWLPGNGEYLGYAQTGLHVPPDAWGMLRAGATLAALASLIVAGVSGVLGVNDLGSVAQESHSR